jgi:hypothetical protein
LKEYQTTINIVLKWILKHNKKICWYL